MSAIIAGVPERPDGRLETLDGRLETLNYAKSTLILLPFHLIYQKSLCKRIKKLKNRIELLLH